MPVFSDLTPTEQTQILSFMPVFRSTLTVMVQAINRLVQLEAAWVAVINDPVTSLDAGTVIPDQTGVPGAADITREELIGLMQASEVVLTNNNTPAARAKHIKVAGLLATLG